MSNNNPYVTVASPSYAAPILDWQGMLNPQQQKQGGNMNGQPQPARPGVMPGAPGQPGQPTQAQQQAQGLGQRLWQMFNGGGQPQPGQPMNINPAGGGVGAQPMMPPQSAFGLSDRPIY
jgi:hypothetical protein